MIGPRIKTALPGPNAKRVLEGDNKYISPSYTRSYPLVAAKGHGVVVTDVDGNEFFDFSAGIAVTSTGHCHPKVVAAIQKQSAELIHMSGTDFYYENMVTLAERLSKIAPMPGPHKIYYGNSGTEAVECALKLARYHTKRQNVIAFYGAFHGRTMGALSLTASKPQQKRRFAPLVPAIAMEFCWWLMKSRVASAAPESGGRWNMPACNPTSFAWPRALLPACRWVWL
jgi:4-aminobutyrate aminotransferase